ncbi:SusC/RagA family TonB-linked outer membrane protein [Pedobacter foliorum]|uniref:SusC/RagA family TonB-linked outer membrane protein n=1 Tax=Pedobacter foliorum TaxID=2739058 RepID=UPI001567C4C8|nr:SusC/RagA family TonB-linked outer membrane protein [Pedobacter foliorum]NRF41126.1 SusC/RagA family TonB-linked outer membrane protein [Pedobacter foliorum]
MKKTILTIVLAILCLIFRLQSQEQDTITGTIYTQDRKPLAGVTIKIMDTDISATTDQNGKFSLVSKTKKGTVIFSYTGYETQSMDYIMGREDKFKIFMRELRSQLQEVEINAGYYTVKERERTGSISRISSQTIEKQPVNNPLQALQGRVPGVAITQQTGLPGGGFSVQIRGRNSITSGNDPLYIVDGVSYPSTNISFNYGGNILGNNGANPLSLLNPYDIETIEVLKDADATAIYGSRGANGVILIKTKKNRTGDSRLNAVFSQGAAAVDRRAELLNTEQYLGMRREAFKNDGLTPTTRDFDVNGTWAADSYTNWQKELIGGAAPMTNAALNLSGSSGKISYLLGGNYYREGTVYPGSFGFNRGGMHSSLDIGSPESPFRASFSTNYSRTNSILPRNDLTQFLALAPNAPDLYDASGNLNWANKTVYINPMALMLRTNKAATDNLIANLNLSYKLWRNLELKGSFGYTTQIREELNKIPLASFAPVNNATAASRVSYFANARNNTWQAEPQLNYSTKLGSGRLEALVGLTFQENRNEMKALEASGFSSDELMENILSAANVLPYQVTYSQYRYTAIFARLNYSLGGKYFMNLTGRRDGSSRFGQDRQFANFGAIGAAWIFSEETLFKENLRFLTFGKLRASYGITGNDQIPDYGYLQLWYSGNSYQGKATVRPNTGRVGNPDFAWETNRKLEAAVQLGFWQDKINLEVSWYRNRSSNQLIGDPLPLSTGSSTITANRPATIENSGLEIGTNFKLINKTNLTWSAAFNMSIPKSRLIAYPGLESSDDAYNYIIGQPLSIRRNYHVNGVNPQTGFYDIEDYDGNGTLDDVDRYRYKFTGQYFFGGIQNSLRYKQFSLDFLFSFVKQNGNNYMSTTTFTPGRWTPETPYGNQLTIVLDRWQQPGDQSQVQRFSTTNSANTIFSDAKNEGGMAIQDASYIRLKNISVSYILPAKLLSAVRIKQASLNIQGQNVLTFSKYKGLDPESLSMLSLPPLRVFSVGLNLTF